MKIANSTRFDVLILGAGAAGLSAAAQLVQSGKTVCILEARDRLGGRIFTRREPGLSIPLELGAEFIHGLAPSTAAWLKRFNIARVDAAQTRWMLRDGKLQLTDDLFEQMKQGLAGARRPKRDIPFSEFLDGAARRTLSARTRELARMLVEGYDAADATRVSTLETLGEWSGEGAADAPTFRPQNGYAALIDSLAGALDPDSATVRLNTIVQEVRWRRGSVIMSGTQQGQPFRIESPRAVITLPLGVLQLPPQASNAVHFIPELSAKEAALGSLAVGPVIKVLFRFRKPFWEELDDGRYRDAAFFHAAGAAFPTLWSSLPMRTPLLCAWAAGPNAARLSAIGATEIVRTALDSVESVFGKRAKLRTQLEGAYMHDWQADPFACGAYSYVTAGAAAARKKLSAPLQRTLFFAGEAADIEGESGTVAGALQSGHRAAHQLLDALRSGK